MKTNFRDSSGLLSDLEISDEVFGCDFKEALVHQVVTAYLAHARQGSHKQKNRSSVQGGGKKPWKQKGSGRARAGTSRSPIWRKGGVTFAANNQNYSQKVNKKCYRLALRSILSELIRQNRLQIIDSFCLNTSKTKELTNKLLSLNISNALIVSSKIDKNLYLAARNLSKIVVCDVLAIDPVSLISFEKVVVTKEAIKQLEETLS